MRTLRSLTATLTILLLAGACASSGNGVEPAPGSTVEVTGILTDEGVECQALRGDDGRLYTLAGETAGFDDGDRVRVRGTVAEMSFCQQGVTLNVLEIRAAS